MKKVLLLAATATGLLSLSLPGQAASFNCKKASNATEKAICANRVLSQLDDELNDNYEILLGYTTNSPRVKREQLNWLRERNQCRSQVACIHDEYRIRISQIQNEIENYR